MAADYFPLSASGSLPTSDSLPASEKASLLMETHRRERRATRLKALLLVAPLLLFVLVVFVFPIGSMLTASAKNVEIYKGLPRTVSAIAEWDGIGLPNAEIQAALVADLREVKGSSVAGHLARRLNYVISGYRSLVKKTVRNLPAIETPVDGIPHALTTIDKKWGQTKYWGAIKHSRGLLTDYYLLASFDLLRNEAGEIESVREGRALYGKALIRTLVISSVVTLLCLILGYPLAYYLASIPAGKRNLLMILVLLPFWTSLLVRTSAWLVLLQNEGVVNDLAVALGLFDERIQLVYNRFGVYVAMVHILLPFMVLPVYSIMKGIDASLMSAASSLGASPALAFRKVYIPLSLPGVLSGCLLVFILSLGYYITPAIVGGPGDQMLSYYIVFAVDAVNNWGMAAALSLILIVIVIPLFAVYQRLAGNRAMEV